MNPSESGERGIPAASWLRRLLVTALELVAIGFAAGYVVSWIPVWPCSLLEHFAVQYVAIGVALVALTAAARRRVYFDLAMLSTLLHALPVTADLCRSPRPQPANGVALRVLVLNVHTQSSSFEQVRQLIRDERPDLVALVEVNQRWLAELAPALADYPGQISTPRADNFGIALYARGSATGSAAAVGSALPTVVADVAIDAAQLRVIVTHPLPPISSAALEQLTTQLDAVAQRARAATGPVLVVGDLNTTPWSRPFARFEARSGLCDSRAGFGIQASFPSNSAVMRIPIDHLLASCSIGVTDRRIGRDVGSDHLPVIVEIRVPRSQ